MKIARFRKDGKERYGILQGEYIQVLSCQPFNLPRPESALSDYLTEECWPLHDVDLKAPCCPSKYIGVGLNYYPMVKALNRTVPEEPFLFLKPSTSVIGSGQQIIIPKAHSKYVCEGELAIVIGKRCSKIQEKDARNYILGYTATNDVTDMSFADSNFSNVAVAKAADTFAPIGPWIETDLDPQVLTIETFVNGQSVQRGNTNDLIFSISQCVSIISHLMTLLPGDIIATGTPSMPPEINPGDVVEVIIEGIGSLTNRVANNN